MTNNIWYFEEIKITDKNLKELDLILRNIGIKITSLKKSHLKRRVRARMMRTGQRVFHDYLKYVQSNKEEQEKLRQAFSINVTRFFRDLSMFKFLQSDVLPEIKTRKADKMIKIWSAGCADGAEPYSLAMLCKELNLNPSRVQIVATDFNQELLHAARKGVYPTEYLSEIPLEFQNQYFRKKTQDKIEISPILKSYCTFKFSNLTSNEREFPLFDLILCRNVLIYFSDEQKEIVLKKFYHMLKSGGFLVLGMTEILHHAFRDRFKIYKGKYHIYTKDSKKEKKNSKTRR